MSFGVVHKLRLQEEGGRWSKKLTFCKLSYHRKCKRRGVGGQKKPNFVNVVCERPLISKRFEFKAEFEVESKAGFKSKFESHFKAEFETEFDRDVFADFYDQNLLIYTL